MSLQNISTLISDTLFLAMVVGIPSYAAIKKVDVFDSFITGAKEGIPVIVKIIPYLVAMIVAIGMLRASGAINSLAHALAPALSWLGMPTDVLPMALIRPFSGSAANGMLVDIIHQHGGNAYVSQVAGTMMGSTETTFYVVAVYFGAVAVRRTRHAIPAGLIADAVGVIAAVWVCQLIFVR